MWDTTHSHSHITQTKKIKPKNQGFVDSPRGVLGDVGAAAEKVPGVGMLLGGLSQV